MHDALRFDGLLSEPSALFVALRPQDIDGAIRPKDLFLFRASWVKSLRFKSKSKSPGIAL